MADFVEIITKQGIQQIKDADNALNSLLSTLRITVSESNKLNVAGGGASKPSQYNANTAKNNAAIERNVKLLERQRLEEIKLSQAREKAFDKYEAALNKEQAKLQASQGIYSKVQQKLNQLNAEYRNLAVQKELTGRLTDAESRRYDLLSTKITKYDTVLKGVDASMGKYQRNVGNYAGAFNPLSNSINQLTREAPAFANSIQTGFLAISNNLPVFFDAMQGVIAQNKILISQGQPVQSVFKQLAGSILSIGTALSLGVTLLTLFGDEIIDAIAGTKAKEEADKKAKEAIDAKSKAEEEYNSIIRQSSSEEISRSKILFENAKNVNLTYDQRKEALDELRERYGKYLKDLSDQDILSGRTADSETRLNDALLKRGIALALQDKIGKSYARLTDEIIKQQEIQRKGLTLEETINKSNLQNKQVQIQNAKILNNAQVISSQQNQANIKKEIEELLKLYNTYSPYLDAVQESGTANAKASEEIIQAETNSRTAFERTISSLEERLSLMSQENSSYGILTGQLMLVKGAYEALYGAQEDANKETEKTIKYGTVEYYQDVINKLSAERDKLADNTEQYALYSRMIQRSQDELDKLTGKKEDIKKLTDEVQKYLNSFSEGFLSEAKLPSLNMFLSINEDGVSPFQALLEQADTAQERFAVTFNAIAQSAQEAFAFMNQNSQAYFDRQLSRLDREKEYQLENFATTEEAKREIESQYEERRREIQRRQAQANKEQALFNIALNTAQGITSALASVPPNIPLSIVIGAICAAQIAMVASRQIPAYKDGTDNHSGGLAIVGDGGKHELVHQPTLGWAITPKKDTLVNLEKGSKVFPDLASSGILDSGLPDSIKLNGMGITKSEMASVLRDTLGQQNQIGINLDKNGFKVWTGNESARKTELNNRVSFKPRRVNRA